MTLNKREYIALELLKVKDITVIEAYEMADDFIRESSQGLMDDSSEATNSESDNSVSDADPIFSLGIEALEMSNRTTTFLKNNKIKTIAQLVVIKVSDMFNSKHYDDYRIEVRKTLAKIKLDLEMNKYEVLDYNSSDHVQIIKGTEGESILKPVS